MFRQIAEVPISHQLFDCAILDDALFLIGSDGFLCLSNETRYECDEMLVLELIGIKNSWPTFKVTAYPVFKGLASSQTYHRCKTSKPINVHNHGDVFLLCYTGMTQTLKIAFL